MPAAAAVWCRAWIGPASSTATTTCRPAFARTSRTRDRTDAPPVLALHGFPQHWYEWRRVIDELPRVPLPRDGHARARLVGPGAGRRLSQGADRRGRRRAARRARDRARDPARPRLGRLGRVHRRRHRARALDGLRRDRHAAPVAAPGRAAAHRPADALPAADRGAVPRPADHPAARADVPARSAGASARPTTTPPRRSTPRPTASPPAPRPRAATTATS